MSFIANILILASVTFAILVPIFVGHALSSHHTFYYLLGAVCGLIAAGFMFATSKVAFKD